jgi:hypothetical protein
VYELLLIGAALYWGERTIHHGRYRYPHLSFSNSNPEIVKTYMLFIRKVLKIKESQIKAGVHIHPNIKEKTARKFWSRTTELPELNFYIFRQVSRSSKLKQGYIDGIIKQLTA